MYSRRPFPSFLMMAPSFSLSLSILEVFGAAASDSLQFFFTHVFFSPSLPRNWGHVLFCFVSLASGLFLRLFIWANMEKTRDVPVHKPLHRFCAGLLLLLASCCFYKKWNGQGRINCLWKTNSTASYYTASIDGKQTSNTYGVGYV